MDRLYRHEPVVNLCAFRGCPLEMRPMFECFQDRVCEPLLLIFFAFPVGTESSHIVFGIVFAQLDRHSTFYKRRRLFRRRRMKAKPLSVLTYQRESNCQNLKIAYLLNLVVYNKMPT